MQNLVASGSTFYGSALTTAFQYFINSPDDMTVHGQERGRLLGSPVSNVSFYSITDNIE